MGAGALYFAGVSCWIEYKGNLLEHVCFAQRNLERLDALNWVLVLRRIPVLVLRDGLMQIVRHRRANKLAVTVEIVLHQMYARVLPIGKDRIVARLYVRKPA